MLLLVAFPASSQCKRGLSVNKEVITLTLDRNTTSAQIESYQKSLKKFNIELKLYQSEFSKEGKLLSATLYVDCNDGFSGSLAGTFQTSKDFIGFYRIYKKEAKSSFGMVKPGAPEKPVSAALMAKTKYMYDHLKEGGTPMVEEKDSTTAKAK